MKLATLKDGSRDGQLMVVSRDLLNAHLVSDVAGTLQRALDDWSFIAPQLADRYEALNSGKARHAFAFDPRRCMAPLPRAFQWIDASCHPSHAERLERAAAAAGAAPEPAVQQGGSDDFPGPCDAAQFAAEDWGIDFAAGLAVAVDDVPAGSTAERCAARIRLLMLANGWSLRTLPPDEGALGFGSLQRRPTTAFAPVAVTPDEFGDDWRAGLVHLPVTVHLNGAWFGEPHAGEDAVFGFAELLAHVARTRGLRAGAIVGGGAVSNRMAGRGCACIAEMRAQELAEHGEVRTGFMKFGDRVRIEVLDRQGMSVFGAIDQQVSPAPSAP